MSTPPGGRGRVRARPWWSWIVVVTVTATLLTAGIFDVVLRRRGRADLVLIGFDDVAMVVALLTCALVGVALMRQRPEHPVGWCFAALALVLCLNALTSIYATWGLWIEPSSLRSPLVVAAIDTALWVPWMPLFALIWSLTPDGHHLSARWRWANIVLIAASGLWFVHGLAAPVDSTLRTASSTTRWPPRGSSRGCRTDSAWCASASWQPLSGRSSSASTVPVATTVGS